MVLLTHKASVRKGASLVVITAEVSPHWHEFQVSIVTGHMVQHVCHGNHHWRVGGLLLFLLFIVFLFLWLLETTDRKGPCDGDRYAGMFRPVFTDL